MRTYVAALLFCLVPSLASADVSSQELGARIGLEAGGRVSPGGLHLEGTYLYRLSSVDWLEQAVGFTFGGRGAACFRDRDDTVICDHGILDGFAADLAVGVRRYLGGQKGFTPFVRAGVALRGVFYSSDELRGLSIPLWLGGGIKASVAPRISITGDAALKTGFGFFNQDLGVEPHASLTISAGVEFVLD